MHQLGVHQQQFMHRDDEGEEQQVDPHVEYLQQLVRGRCTLRHEDSTLFSALHARQMSGRSTMKSYSTDSHRHQAQERLLPVSHPAACPLAPLVANVASLGLELGLMVHFRAAATR